MSSVRKMERIAQSRLEHFDRLRVTNLLQDYHERRAARVHVRLPARVHSFGSVAEVSIELTASPGGERGDGPGMTTLATMSMPWPPEELLTTGRRPLNHSALEVRVDGAETPHTVTAQAQGLALLVASEALSDSGSQVSITFTSPSIFFLMRGSEPFREYCLGFDVTLPPGVRSILVLLDHPPDVSLRCRIDNSEYHSLAYSVGQDHVRKMTFVHGRAALMRYLYGDNDEAAMRSITHPLLGASLSLIAGALTISLLESDLVQLATVPFALLILPPLVQMGSRKLRFYPSADIRRLSFQERTWVLAWFVAVLMIVASVLHMLGTVSWGSLVQWVGYVGGTFLLVAAIAFLTLLQEQVVPRHSCDNCARRISWRRRARLHLESRRTLCGGCYERHSIDELEQRFRNGGFQAVA